MPITNPYPPAVPGSVNHKVAGRVSVTDYAYMERLFPMVHGLQDKDVATLYKALIDEIRRLEKENGTPFEGAWSLDHPTAVILDQVLSRVNFRNGAAAAAGPTPSKRRKPMKPLHVSAD